MSELPGGGHVAVRADLMDSSALGPMVEEAVDGLGGGLDVLVNNAGVFLPTPSMTSVVPIGRVLGAEQSRST